MAKLPRETLKQFGSTGIDAQFEQFGSFANAAIVQTKDVTIIQALGAWLEGWFGAVVGSLYPTIQDMNGLFFVVFYFLCYLYQTGTPEWDSGTTYYIGSQANDGTGVIYTSITDNNLNNPLNDGVNWKKNGNRSSPVQVVIGSASDVTLGYADFSTWAAALAANPNNTSFFINKNYTGAEVITLNGNNLSVQGQGYNSVIGGITCTALNCRATNVRCSGNISIAGNITGNFIRQLWLDLTFNAVDNSGPGQNSLGDILQN